MGVNGEPAGEAQEQVLAVRIDRAYGTTGEPLRPTIEAVARMWCEDLLGHSRLQHRADARDSTVDRVALGHTRRIAEPASVAERMTTESEPHPVGRSSRARSLSAPGARRATVIGAGSFGTALAVLLARGGLRTTLQTRTAEQAELIDREHENRQYLPGVELPGQLRIEPASSGVARADYVFLAVPSRGLADVIDRLGASGLGNRTAVVSVAKGLVPPHGQAPTAVLGATFGAG